jgi:hypothetical protein
MQIATILPTAYLNYTRGDSYFMALAHLMKKDPGYRAFFVRAAAEGNFVLLDNGIVETGYPMQWSRLEALASECKVSEVVLPDCLNDREETIRLGLDALNSWAGECALMAVPQGKNFDEWKSCLEEIMKWPVSAIGISKFTKRLGMTRHEVLQRSDNLIDSSLDIHLLGCNATDDEIYLIEQDFPGRIRGVDSGVAAIYSQEGLKMHPFVEKPNVELDFSKKDMNESLLIKNIDVWKSLQYQPPIKGA